MNNCNFDAYDMNEYRDEMKIKTMRNTRVKVNFDVLEEKWRLFYRFLDYNKNGVVSEMDFDNMAWNIYRVYKSEGNGSHDICRALKAWWVVFKKHVGSTRHISVEDEFVKAIQGLFEADRSILKAQTREMAECMFHLIDVNGDGVIARSEYVKMFKAMGVGQSCYVGRVFDKLDTDKSGVLEKDEFLNAMENFFLNDSTSVNTAFIFKFPEG